MGFKSRNFLLLLLLLSLSSIAIHAQGQAPQWNTTIPDQSVNASAGLAVVPGRHFTVMNASVVNANTGALEPTPNGTFNHGPMIAHFEGFFYVSWYNSPHNEAENQRVLCKTSHGNANAWMAEPLELFPNLTAMPGMYNEAFSIINKRLYASASVQMDAYALANVTQRNKGYVMLVRWIEFIHSADDYRMSDIFWLTSTVPRGFEALDYKTYLEMAPQPQIRNDMEIYFNSLFVEDVQSVVIGGKHTSSASASASTVVVFNQTTSIYALPTTAADTELQIISLLRAYGGFPENGENLNLFWSSCNVSKSVLTQTQFNDQKKGREMEMGSEVTDSSSPPLFACRAGTQMYVNLFEMNYNLDNGLDHSNFQSMCNWTTPQITNIADAPGRACMGSLANTQHNHTDDAYYYLLGSQASDSQFEDRKVLTIAITDRDTRLYFNRVYAIRYDPPAVVYPGHGKSPQYAYPSATWIQGQEELYVAYDAGKEDIIVSVINISDLIS